MSRRKNKSAPWRDDAIEAVRHLRAGNVIVHASDTVWGIACDSTNPAAVSKLRSLKNRSEATPILILVAEEGQVEKHFAHVPDAVWDLFKHNDRPTTVVLPGGKDVDKSILAEDGSLGVRIVKDPWMEFVANGLGRPIASTSANMSGILKKLQIVDEISAKEVLSPILLLSILFLKATRGTYSLE